jgi:cell division protease FtsH
MSDFPWFPFGHRIPGGATGPLRRDGPGFQIIGMQDPGQLALVVDAASFMGQAVTSLSPPTVPSAMSFTFGGKAYLSWIFRKEEQPVAIRDCAKSRGLPNSSELDGLAGAVRALRDRFPNAEIASALYLPATQQCLPVAPREKREDLRALAIEVLTGGASIVTPDAASVRAVNNWILPEDITTFMTALGVDENTGSAPPPADPGSFSLPGRPRLERLFREYVIEPYADRDRYAALGVQRPNGILLYGPPGSGKTYAVGKLRAALGWSCYEIALGAMGSPFIHQTSVALRQTFTEAQRNAPAIILMEEVDALATSRVGETQSYKTEEVAELLRLVETASANNILVIGTTNRRDSLDPAILRKGRFDLQEEVGYPDQAEVKDALQSMLRERPHGTLSNVDKLAGDLANRPMSDVSWVINEAARLAARGKKAAIDEIDLFSAASRLPKR